MSKPTNEVVKQVIESIKNLDIENIEMSAGVEERKHPTEEGVTQARSSGELTITIGGRIKDFKLKEWGE